MVSRSQRLCRLCEFPAADGGVPLDALDAEKWAEWCRRELGEELQISSDAEQVLVICQFCIWEARFAHDNGSLDDCSGSTVCDWWSGLDEDHFHREYFYNKPLIQPCKVVLNNISSDPGQNLLGTITALNASQICSQGNLEPHQHTGCPDQAIEFDSNLKSEKKIFKCTLCNKIFKYGNNITQHIKSIHKNAVRCKSRLCTTYFLTDIERRLHEEKIHLSEGSGKSLKCIFCGALLSGDLRVVNHHVRKMHKNAIKCDFDYRKGCPNYFHTEAEKNKHILEVHNKVDLDPKQCIYCGKTCKNNYYLMTHIRTMHADIKIKCRFKGCSVYFLNQNESEEHFLKKHQHTQSLKKWLCPKCTFRTSRKDSLQNHLLSIHTKETTLKCPHCPKGFSVKKNLTLHLKLSHGERCTCEHCGKTLPNKESLQFHFLRKHAVLS